MSVKTSDTAMPDVEGSPNTVSMRGQQATATRYDAFSSVAFVSMPEMIRALFSNPSVNSNFNF